MEQWVELIGKGRGYGARKVVKSHPIKAEAPPARVASRCIDKVSCCRDAELRSAPDRASDLASRNGDSMTVHSKSGQSKPGPSKPGLSKPGQPDPGSSDADRTSASWLRDELADTLRRSRFLSLLTAGVCALFAVLLVAGVRAYGDLADARSRERELEQLVHEADERVADLEGQIERIESDDTALERVAREELGMLFPNEYVVLLTEENNSDASTGEDQAKPDPIEN